MRNYIPKQSRNFNNQVVRAGICDFVPIISLSALWVKLSETHLLICFNQEDRVLVSRICIDLIMY